MNRLLRASEIIGLPVVSIASGEDVAEIRDVVYDSEHHRILGFTLNKRGFLSGRLADALPVSHAAIGPDAVMVPDDAAITDTDNAEAVVTPDASVDVIGDRVVTSEGDDLGVVIDVVLQAGDEPQAVGYEIEPTDGDGSVFVPISAQMAISADNLLLPPGATEFVRQDLAGFGAAVLDYRTTLEGN